MKITGERYSPRVGNGVFAPYEPFVSYEHWHRYCYALPFIEGKTVLDIASGEGYGSAFLAAHARLVYGVDISEEVVQHARESYGRDNLHFLQGEAAAIPIPGEHCFDVIVSFETIEHLDATGQERFAAEVSRLLKPDGVLLISTPNRETYSKDGVQGNPYHFHEFTTAEFLAFLHRSFAHVRLLSQHVYPVSYIWNLEPTPGEIVEYQMSVREGRFRPGSEEGKEIGYLIAVCGQQEERTFSPNSLLLDLSEVAFRGIPHRERWQTTSLSSEVGPGSVDPVVVREEVEYTPDFVLEFTIDPPREFSQLRWDPLEGRLCRVRLRQILWEDVEGLVTRLDLGRVWGNGRNRADGTLEFATLDPMIYLPIAGQVARVTIEGECLVGDVPATMAGLEQSVRSREQELDQQGREVQALRERLTAQQQAARAERGRWEREVEQRDRQIEQRDRQIEQRDRQIEQRDRDIFDARNQRDRAEAELVAAFGSMSFRLTAPLRAAARLARRAWRRSRAPDEEADRQATSLRPPSARRDDPGAREPGAARQRQPGHGARSQQAMASTLPRPAAGRHAEGMVARDDDRRGEGQAR
jgi:SAM-dependent methyltransferase